MKKTAIILGATGLTGGVLLQKLIVDERYESIKLFSRSKIQGLPSKVHQFIGDLLQLDQFKEDFTADEVYCCIGTTTKKTPNKELYKQIDFGIVVNAATLCKQNNIPTFLVVSAMGANSNSSLFYNRIKGEMEQAVMQQNIKHTYLLRPSFIGGKRKEQRVLEKIALFVFKVLQPLFIGKLKDYKIIDPKNIAQAMINLANNTKTTEVIITSSDIYKFSN